jgi:hypothetical protein
MFITVISKRELREDGRITGQEGCGLPPLRLNTRSLQSAGIDHSSRPAILPIVFDRFQVLAAEASGRSILAASKFTAVIDRLGILSVRVPA